MRTRETAQPLASQAVRVAHRLDSWKEIASYLKRSDKTVRRWEEQEGLPIHRVIHGKRGTVYAYPEEIEAWLESRKEVSEGNLDLQAGDSPKKSGSTDKKAHGPVGSDKSLEARRAALSVAVSFAIGIGALVGILILVIPLGVGRISLVSEPGRLSEQPLTTFPGNEVEPNLSPDGDQLAFAFDEGGSSHFHIYVKAIGSEHIQRLTSGEADDMSPSWSPDGQTIAFLRFFSDQKAGVLVIPCGGGPGHQVTVISVDRTQRGIRVAWSPDGRLLATSDAEAPLGPMRLVLISLLTGQKQRLIYEPSAVEADLSPSFSPDGRFLAYTRHLSPAVADLYVLPFSSFGAGPLHANALTDWNRLITSPTWTGDGQEIVFAGDKPGKGQGLWRVSVSGHGEARPIAAAAADRKSSISLSPRRNRLVYSKQEEDTNIWQLSLRSSLRPQGEHDEPQRVRLIASTSADENPQYSPDGRFVAFQSQRSGDAEIWVANSDGSHPRQLTRLRAEISGYPRWSPDGSRIVFHSRPSGFANLYVLEVRTGAYRQLTTGATNDSAPSWSHDGRWIYFCSERSGEAQIWRIPADGGRPEQITKNGGAIAFDSFDGKQIFYSKFADPGLWALPIESMKEQRIIPALYSVDAFAISTDGIYFLSPGRDRGNVAELEVLRRSSIRNIAVISAPVSLGFSVSADGGHLLYSQVDQSGSDLVLMDQFR